MNWIIFILLLLGLTLGGLFITMDKRLSYKGSFANNREIQIKKIETHPDL